MYVVVTYDIKNDKQRGKLAKELLQFGIRTQKSFFECEINERELKIIKKIVRRYSEPEDFVTIYHTDKKKIKRESKIDYFEIDDLVF